MAVRRGFRGIMIGAPGVCGARGKNVAQRRQERSPWHRAILMDGDSNGVQRGLRIWVKEVPTSKFSRETFGAVYINDTRMKNKQDKNVHIIPIYIYERLQCFSFPFPFSFLLSRQRVSS